MSPDPEHEIPEDDGPSPLGAEGEAPFGTGPFGEGPFGPGPEVPEDEEEETPAGETILQRHKVDLVGISKRRWREFRFEQRARRRQEAIAAKAAKEARAKEVVEVAQYEQQWKDYHDDGLSQFNRLLFQIEQQEQDRLAKIITQFAVDAMGRQAAIDAFNKQAMMQERMARLRQFQRDTDEEGEALELLMMDD
jgi:hypothetical protein